MKAFTLRLQDATHAEDIEGVTSFVGEDASGSFGLLADHARFMTALVFGLARFRVGTGAWQYLAMPGALLLFHDNVLTLNTNRYLIDADYRRISAALQEQMLAEEEQVRSIKESLHRIEQEAFRHLWELGRPGDHG